MEYDERKRLRQGESDWYAGLRVQVQRTSSVIVRALIWLADRYFQRIPFRPDRYDGKFFFKLAGVLVFTGVAYWLLTEYDQVQWFAGEDGVSEWWSVATYLAAAMMAIATAALLKSMGHPRIAGIQVLFALAFVIGAGEEISWGQRLFDWSTPETLNNINVEGETTVHNIPNASRTLYTAFSITALVGVTAALIRGILILS